MAKWGPRPGAGWVIALIAALSLTSAAPAAAEFEFLGQWGAPGTGELVAATDVDQDVAGNTYALDAINGRIHKLGPANQPLASWGVLFAEEKGFVTAMGVNPNSGVVYAAYVGPGVGGSPGTAEIRRYDASGNLLGQFGSLGTAEGEFDLGIAGISVDRVTGRVYVAEGQRVQRFSAAGQFQRMWGRNVDPGGGTGAEICTAGCQRGIQGEAEGEFTYPTDIATDGPRVYVVEDTNKRVQRFSADGTFQRMAGRDVDIAGGTGAEICQTNCKAGTGGTALGELDEPEGIDVSGALGVVYLVDSRNHRVQRWNIDLNPIAEFGTQGTGDGQFESPGGLGEEGGEVVVTDLGLLRVQQFDSAGVFQTRLGEPSQSTLIFPGGLGAGEGGVYVTDSRHRVVRFDPEGAFVSTWGTQGTGVGQFDVPAGLAVGESGEVYVADSENDRIQRFDAGGAALGAWGTTGAGDGQFDGLLDVAAAGERVFTLETLGNTRIQRFSPIGAFGGTWGASGAQPGQFGSLGIGTDAAGNVYVADTSSDRIQKFSPDGALLDFWGTPGTGPGELDSPSDVAVDRLGNVYVADNGNERIQRFDSSGNLAGEWGVERGGAGFVPGSDLDRRRSRRRHLRARPAARPRPEVRPRRRTARAPGGDGAGARGHGREAPAPGEAAGRGRLRRRGVRGRARRQGRDAQGGQAQAQAEGEDGRARRRRDRGRPREAPQAEEGRPAAQGGASAGGEGQGDDPRRGRESRRLRQCRLQGEAEALTLFL